MKGFFPESLGQKGRCALYTGTHYTWQNMVHLIGCLSHTPRWWLGPQSRHVPWLEIDWQDLRVHRLALNPLSQTSQGYLLILEWKKGKESEKETLIYCSTYWCISLVDSYMCLTRERTCSLGISAQCSNPLN